ncbi:DUF3859 domain-containing protein [Cytophaga aurantiaca]|uniref:DUF3859 domain-containing protein n=1 Tax=Cytophaga aurantiaca TaxID=29530 RepID=UPI0003742891|nr:DUF3859 domain-containing protein [Cytophaga aurantiaca]
MKKLILGVFVIVLTSATNKSQKLNLKFVEIGYGICETEEVFTKKNKEAPTGTQAFSDGFVLIKQTDTIPAILGQQFGVTYEIQSANDKSIDVEQAWIFPQEMINNEGQKFKEIRYTLKKSVNRMSFSTYSFDKKYEIVKGQWTFQMLHKGVKIYERKFFVE